MKNPGLLDEQRRDFFILRSAMPQTELISFFVKIQISNFKNQIPGKISEQDLVFGIWFLGLGSFI